METSHIKKAAIFGGTFDPIHYGHLLAAERAREKFSLDCVFFIPSGNPPHKKYEKMASSKDRYAMTQLAVKGNPNFEILDIEQKREGYSYTIDTVREVKALLGFDKELFFIIGADNAAEILKWNRADELIKETEFIVVSRPGDWEESLDRSIREIRGKNGRIHVAQIPMIPITSTDIREKVQNGKSIKNLVPQEVEEYIYANGLYR